ncbi:hypothetical protein Tco_0177668, partial [Tanacetum coccineum]
AYEFHQDRASSVKSTGSKCHSVFLGTLAMRKHRFSTFKLADEVSMFLLGLLALAIDAACAFRAEEMPSLISCWIAAKVMVGVSDVDVLLGDILLKITRSKNHKF